jgi:hypothetical protein
MKKMAVLSFIFLIIYPNIFADENINEFENVFFTWQLYNYYTKGNNQNLIFILDLNKNLMTQPNQLLIFNLQQQNTIPQFSQLFRPIGPVTSFIWMLFFGAALAKYIDDWEEYLINNPIDNIRSWQYKWEPQWIMEAEREKENTRKSLQGAHSFYIKDPNSN